MLLIGSTEDYASGWLLFRDPCWAGGACGAATSTHTRGTFNGHSRGHSALPQNLTCANTPPVHPRQIDGGQVDAVG